MYIFRKTAEQTLPQMKWLMMAIAATLLLAACNHNHRSEMGMDFIAYQLDFSDEQKAIMKNLHNEIQLVHQQMHAEQPGHHQQLIEFLKADQLNRDQLQQFVDDQHRQIKLGIDRLFDQVAMLHATLTPAQKNQIITRLEKHRRH